MTAEQAYEHTMSNMDRTLFVDIRTPSELNYLGAATVMDAHVPLVFMDSTGWDDKKHATSVRKTRTSWPISRPGSSRRDWRGGKSGLLPEFTPSSQERNSFRKHVSVCSRFEKRSYRFLPIAGAEFIPQIPAPGSTAEEKSLPPDGRHRCPGISPTGHGNHAGLLFPV